MEAWGKASTIHHSSFIIHHSKMPCGLYPRLSLLFLFLVLSLPLVSQPSGPKIPECLVGYQFGPEQYMVIVEKSTQNLYIYSNYRAEPIETFKITTGKNHGPKMTEGDMKTPEGLYLFKRVLSGDELPKAEDYGEKAFTLNYPNPIDIKEKRLGSGIWLHGAFEIEKIDTPNSSKGCVVMRNQDLVNLSKYIFLNQTPICIYSTIKYDTVENIREKRDRLINHLKDWKTDWETKNLEGYIGYYDKDFVYDGLDLDRFKAVKRKLNEAYRFIRVMLSDIDIYAFENYFLVMFNQLYISDKNHFYSKKIQYWRDYGDEARIADEASLRLPQPNKFEISTGNYVTIEEFRKDYLQEIKTETVSLVPHEVHLRNISLVGPTVKLMLVRTESARDLRVIPVLRLEDGTATQFQSLEGIALEGGVPKDYSKGIRLVSSETTVLITREKNIKLKSLTLFLVNHRDTVEQIVTYFVNLE